MSKYIESYNIHDTIKFNLINKMRFGGIFKAINPEYEYFKTNSVIDDPDFSIIIHDYKSFLYKSKTDLLKYKKYKDYYFLVELDPDQKLVDVLRFRYKLKGFRNIFGYLALKNIFVRSLLSIHMINRNCTLVHGGGVSNDGKASIFVGRPGVFKTTIVMKLIKDHKMKYLGEENIFIDNNKVYPFPLNKRSFHYKFHNWDNENPESSLDKILLGLNILTGYENTQLEISAPSVLENIFLIKKCNVFSIRKVNFSEEILDQLINNEKLELPICPTHSFSGIHTNIIENIYEHYITIPTFQLSNIWDRLRIIFNYSIKNKNIYQITVPHEYSNYIHLTLLKYIS